MRVNPRLLGLTVVVLAALAVPAFAGAGISGLSAIEGPGAVASEAEVEFFGAVVSMTAEAWVVGDQTVVVTPDTEIQDGIDLGDIVKVHAWPGPDGTLTAREIEIEDDGAVEDIDNGAVEDGERQDIDNDDVDDAEHQDIDDDDVDDAEHQEIDDDDADDEHDDVDDDADDHDNDDDDDDDGEHVQDD